MKLFYPTSCLAAFALAGTSSAAVITDTTATGATNDGTVNVGEYVGSTEGINAGFGGVIGAGSFLSVDSDTSGGLQFALQPSGTGDLNDRAVIYIDSVAGGVAGTSVLTDTGDGLRRMVSGSSPNGSSDLTFAPGFTADYAIGIESGFAGVFQIVAGGSHNFVTSVNLNPTGDSTAAAFEMNLLLSDIGLAVGDSFDYVATYANPFAGGAGDEFFRSDEFQGVASFGGGNPGSGAVVLGSGDFHTFNSIPEPASLALLGLGGLMMVGRRRA